MSERLHPERARCSGVPASAGGDCRGFGACRYLQPPGVLRMAGNLARDLGRHILAGARTVTKEIAQTRLAQCESCLPPNGFFEPTARRCLHPECGCFMDAKATMATTHCPVGKWAPLLAQFVCNADGIGDHLMGMTVCAAWKTANPGSQLVYVVKSRQWVELFEGCYDHLADAPVDQVPVLFPEINNRGGLHFVEAVARHPQRQLPTLRPLSAEATAWAAPYRGAVVLAPITLAKGSGTRNWLKSHWLELERQLLRDGYRVVVIAGGDDGPKLTGFRSPVILGEPAANVAALMLASACLVSNESGMGHLAGALQVPCIVLAAHLDGAAIHGFWPRTRVIQGPLPCTACTWQINRGWRPACDSVCACLQAITPERVLAEVESAALTATAPLLDGPAADAELRAMIGKLRCERGGEVPSYGDRARSMPMALRCLLSRSPLIVETGCQRADEDWSAGMSTQFFGRYCRNTGGRLISIDNDPSHVAFARERTAELPVTVVEADSREWLRDYRGPMIDLLYLDACDTYTPGYAESCLEEAVQGSRHTNAILIDDTWRQGDGWAGKGKLAVPHLMRAGWRVEYQGHQVLLRRAP